jgi:hypothetical protein
MKALTVKMEMVTLFGRSRHALCINSMKLIVKYFFLAGVLFLWGHPRFG